MAYRAICCCKSDRGFEVKVMSENAVTKFDGVVTPVATTHHVFFFDTEEEAQNFIKNNL